MDEVAMLLNYILQNDLSNTFLCPTVPHRTYNSPTITILSYTSTQDIQQPQYYHSVLQFHTGHTTAPLLPFCPTVPHRTYNSPSITILSLFCLHVTAIVSSYE
jgi:hypothetical protein